MEQGCFHFPGVTSSLKGIPIEGFGAGNRPWSEVELPDGRCRTGAVVAQSESTSATGGTSDMPSVPRSFFTQVCADCSTRFLQRKSGVANYLHQARRIPD